MATVNAVVDTPFGGTHRAKWAAVTQADVGNALDLVGMVDVTVQVLGTFGGTTCTIQGSNDGGVTWATLKSLVGANLSFTAAGLEGVAEAPRQIRPSCAGGAGASLDIYAIVRRRA